MRILWSSNAPWVRTGYGVQTKLVLERLQKYHYIACLAWYGLEGAMLNWNGVPVYPKQYHPYGADVLGPHSMHFNADITITLIDAWVQEPDALPPGIRWVPWFPIDHDPIPPPVRDKVAKAFARLVYSKFGEAKMLEAGLDSIYIPHCVDTNVYKPMNKAEARALVNLPNDRFIVGMVAANKGNNPSRKSWPQCLEAFAQFAKRHDDAILYLHTTRGEGGEMQGVDLPTLSRHLGIEDKVFYVDPYANYLGLDDKHMVATYSAFDVLLSPSMGEGFGVPILEAQSCGVPVITGDWTSMSELTFSGWMVPKSEASPCWNMGMNSYQFLPRTEAIADLLLAAYDNAATANPAAARAGAMAYDADVVVKQYWLPALDSLAARIDSAKAFQSRFIVQPVLPGTPDLAVYPTADEVAA